jgi:acyl carrier protein phosphodiesterase
MPILFSYPGGIHNYAVILLMNYLAHAFLSFDEADILTGNMISDFVKGKRKLDYPPSVQKGIYLHRLIDSFTDSHPVTSRAKEFFRSAYRLYSGAFVDIVYDHFLALDHKQFVPWEGLENFARRTYDTLDGKTRLFPLSFQKMYPYMKSGNWLYNYRLKSGMRQSFGGLVHRAAYLDDPVPAYNIFNEHYAELSDCYTQFFPELKEYAFHWLEDQRGK